MRAVVVLFVSTGCDGLCKDLDALEPADVFAIGDSSLAFGSSQCVSAVDFASRALGRRILNQAVGGAEVLGGRAPIPEQVPDPLPVGSWSSAVVIGGGNDLPEADVCDGADAEAVLDQLATQDGSEGAIPALVDKIVADGTSVLLLGYYRTPTDARNRIGPCQDELGQLRERYRAVAESRPRVEFLDLGLAIEVGEVGLLADDLLHPNPDGAEALGELIAARLAR
jgi:acyl-CoA thioesterase I